MRNCPNCQAEVDDNLDVCWNCLYSFLESKTLNENDFTTICPFCQIENKKSASVCIQCKQDLSADPTKREAAGKKELNCLRCSEPLDYRGNYEFQERSLFNGTTTLEFLFNKESFDLYYCQKCGKIEFYLHGI